jgi:phenylacetyl-CoA:acceptor oxidoreductase
MGTFAFLAAWGPPMGLRLGQAWCYPEHLTASSGTARIRCLSPDTPLTDYLISCGANVEASGGVVGVWRHANARIRGMKRVQVEPHLSVTGACSAEWVPIKPKTDAAFLYALVYTLLHEIPRERLDVAFLSRYTASPYLVGPKGMLQPLADAQAARAGIIARAAAFDTRSRRGVEGSRPTPLRSARMIWGSLPRAVSWRNRSPNSSSTWRHTRPSM